ncbi:MAG: hypothetical protein WBM04_04350, partial [Candidatus Korobacteraceae bacterium]
MRFPFPPPEAEAAGSAADTSEESQPQEPTAEAIPLSAEPSAATEIVSPTTCDLAADLAAAQPEVSLTKPELPPAADRALPELAPDPEPQPVPLPRPKA